MAHPRKIKGNAKWDGNIIVFVALRIILHWLLFYWFEICNRWPKQNGIHKSSQDNLKTVGRTCPIEMKNLKS